MQRRSALAVLLLAAACEDRPDDPGGMTMMMPPVSTTEADGRLATGDVNGAFVAYGSSTGPTASFGACLTRTLLLVEKPPMTAALARFGDPPMHASDLAGPRGILSRTAASWMGTGAITAAAPLASAYNFTRGRDTGAYFTAKNFADKTSLSVTHSGGALTIGQSEQYSYDCATGRRSAPALTPTLSLAFNAPGWSCWQPATVASGPGCNSDGGNISVVATSPSIELRFDDVLVSCNCTGINCSGTDMLVRLDGQATGLANAIIDTSGLHPLLVDVLDGSLDGAAYERRVAAGTTVDQVFRELLPLTTELEAAAAECERAGQGTGVVFTVPGASFGGTDLPVTAGDAKLAAMMLKGAAAAMYMASAYELPLDISLLCDAALCVKDAAVADELNHAVPILRTPTDFARARPLLESAIALGIAGIDALGADSLIPRNADTTAGLDQLRAWAVQLQGSFSAGLFRLDGMMPVVRIDLMSLFAAPPDPMASSFDPVVWETGELRAVDMFFGEVLGPAVDLVYDGSQEYSGPEDATRPTKAFDDALARHGMVFP